MKIVFHGANAASFVPGFSDLVTTPHTLAVVSDALDAPGEAEALAAADVVVGARLTTAHPRLSARLYQVPGAGTDGVDRAALPPGCALCNCFGHEVAIAEYVMAALLARHVPLADADARLRRGDWRYWAGRSSGIRTELAADAVGIVGYGHIGRAVAARAAAFGMSVSVANRSPVSGRDLAATYPLARLADMAARVDVLVVTLPLDEDTRGLVGAEVLGAMKPTGYVVNVGRGPVIDEDALYEALSEGRIGGAAIDTWYVYPTADDPSPLPSRRPFHLLPNVTMTPHMSGWTEGTIARRRAVMAGNVDRLAEGRPLAHPVG